MESKSTLYKPLPQGQWFRLLQLFPGEPEDPIECELIMSKLDQSPDYEPVSYAWGSPVLCEEIVCNGSTVLVTTNAYQLLRRFRKKSDKRMIWLDGICIDQTNDKEKNHQVSFMSSIYDHGSRTLVWLGEVEDINNYEHSSCRKTNTNCVEGVLKLVKSLNRHTEEEFERVDQTSYEGDAWDKIDMIFSMPTMKSWLANIEQWDCAIHFFSRSYFSRCWVLGEVGISTRATAFCGPFSLQWSEIVLFAQISSSTMTASLHQRLPLERFNGIFDYMWVFMTKENSWMKESKILQGTKESSKNLYSLAVDNLALRVLNSSRGFNATDARDHIFAFLGHPSLQNMITPNYTSSLQEIYQEFGVNCIRSTGSLDILSFVDNNESDLHSNLPSWVPQWHRPIIHSKEIHPQWEWLKQDLTELTMTAQISLLQSKL